MQLRVVEEQDIISVINKAIIGFDIFPYQAFDTHGIGFCRTVIQFLSHLRAALVARALVVSFFSLDGWVGFSLWVPVAR